MIYLIVLIISVLSAGAISGRLGWYLARITLQDLSVNSGVPAWLDAVAPVKGRWLRLLLAVPAIGLLALLTFIASVTLILMSGPLMLAAGPAMVALTFSGLKLPAAEKAGDQLGIETR